MEHGLHKFSTGELQVLIDRANVRAGMHESFGRSIAAQMEREVADEYAREIQRRHQALMARQES